MAITGARLTNEKALIEAIEDAFATWADEDINRAHWQDQFMDMGKWQWDGYTTRKNGEVVYSPRDIYDLGDLYRSGVDSFYVEQTTGGSIAHWHWDARNNKKNESGKSSGEEYAFYVHYGTEKHPARPFTDDIALDVSFFRKGPGKALKLRMNAELSQISRMS